MKVLSRLLMSVALAAASLSAHSADKVVVAYLPTLHGLPLFVALEEKLFEKAGLDVEATKFENPNQIIDSLVSGRADSAPSGGAAGITALAETRFPGKLRVFGLQGSATVNGAVNDALIVKADSLVKSFADLKGKKVAHAPGIQWRTITRTVVKANGLDPDKDVELTEMAIGLHAQAVMAGTVDAALTLEPVGSVVVAGGQLKAVVVNPAGRFIVDPFYAGAGVITTKFITERPDVARRFIAVMDEAVIKVSKNFDAYRKHLIGYTPVTAQTVSVVKPMHFVGSGDLREADIAAYQKFADIFVAGGAMKDRVDVSKLILRRGDLK